MNQDGNVCGSGGVKNSLLKAGAPVFGAGLRIDGADVAVAADKERLIHVWI